MKRAHQDLFFALVSLAIASGCSTPVVSVNVNIVTTACPDALAKDPQRAPTAGVTTLRFTLSGDDLATLTQDVPFANNGGSIPNVPIGKNRRLRVDARAGTVVRARADSGPFDVSASGGDVNLTLFLRVVDAFVFTGNTTSSACTHMNIARAGHQMTELADGRVLITGGYNLDPATSQLQYLTQAELYDPRTGTFANVGAQEVYARANHLAVPVTVSGQSAVLLFGGEGPTGSGGEGPVTSFELYQGGAFNSLAFPSTRDTPRERAAMAVDQKTGYPVLAGGANGPAVPNSGVTVSGLITYFNPALDEINNSPDALAQPIADAVAVSRKNVSTGNIAQGGVVLLGGVDMNGVASAQISGLLFSAAQHEYVADTTFTSQSAVSALPAPRVGHSAVVAPDDTIFVLGGSTVANDSSYQHTTAAVTVVDPSAVIAGNATENLSQARADGCATLLQGTNPAILYIGGAFGDSSGKHSTGNVDLINPSGLASTVRALEGPTAGGNWALQSSRHHEACLTLRDGTVLVTGGLQFSNDTGTATVSTVSSAEIYTPPSQ